MTRRKGSPGIRIETALQVMQLQSFRAHLYEMARRQTGVVVDPILHTLMAALERLGPVRVMDLAREVGLDRSMVSRHAAALERAALVERQPDPYDRRSVLVHLTEAGSSELDGMHRAIAQGIDRQLDAWPAAEAEQFSRQLERFIEGVHAAWLSTPTGARHIEPAKEADDPTWS
jgi:DNA-binding MarR family transcriptional regulator